MSILTGFLLFFLLNVPIFAQTTKIYIAQIPIFSSDDNPCAFLRGVIHGDTYHYETPGFDPAYEQASPGTVLLLKAIEDLIANTDCKTFDFGRGGDKTGYKSMFGNCSYEAISLELFRKGRTYPSLLLAMQAGSFALNRIGQAVVGPKLRPIIRQRLRKYGC